jgi:hypothetical protein
MEQEDVQARLNAALERFRAEDMYLLENDLNERCIASRLALHLQRVFPDHKVDVEYNRAGEVEKRVRISAECDTRKNRKGDPLAVPDVIVHQRGDAGPNVLVLEFKKPSNPEGWDCDRERVIAFREYLNYEFGALIECETEKRHNAGIRVATWIDDDGCVDVPEQL